MKNIEIEKKIILKSLPEIEYDQILNITQYYLRNSDGIWERYRKSTDQDGLITYIKTIKTTIRKGVSLEDEDIISEVDYNRAKLFCRSGEFESRMISKVRHIKFTNDNLKWEIDDFKDINITIAEIEIPSDDYEVIYPDYISNNMIKDVTGQNEFNNRRMSHIIFGEADLD